MPSFGTLKADTLTHSTAGSVATNYMVKGSAKAWVRVDSQNDSPAAIEFSFITSSITDNGTGDVTVTFSAAFSNSLYPYSGMDSNSCFVGTKENRLQSPTAGVTATTFGFKTLSDSGVAVDTSKTSVVFHGELA